MEPQVRNGRDDPRVERWERLSEWPLLIAALLFLAAYAWPILDPHLDRALVHACRVTTALTWLAFVVDYVGRLALSRDRWRFVRRHVIDLLVVLLPFLRPLQLVRLVAFLNVLNRHATAALRGRVAAYVIVTTTIVVFVSSLAVLAAERRAPGATIRSYEDALWWAVTTVSTVGYGDTYPVTGPGRVVATVLMIAGVGLLGVVSATFASWLINRVADVDQGEIRRSDVVALTREVQQLRAQLAAQEGRERNGSAG